jgi:uncharacterized protein (TIGR02598 family)
MATLKLPFLRRRHRKSRGFTLLEVIISLGIVASAMLALVGVMPVGVEAIHEASITSIESRIAQEIISDAQAADWFKKKTASTARSNILVWDLQGTRYYDKYGRLQEKRVTEFPDPTVFYAKVEISADSGNERSPTAYVLQQGRQYHHLRKIRVLLEYVPGGREPTFDLKNTKRRVKEFTGLIANVTKDIDMVGAK